MFVCTVLSFDQQKAIKWIKKNWEILKRKKKNSKYISIFTTISVTGYPIIYPYKYFVGIYNTHKADFYLIIYF